MSSRTAPERHQLPAVQKMWVQFAKRGRLRFTSHRDFQRAFERALRRAGVPVAFSHGFTPHPKVSFIGAAPTGSASEAEFLEISLTDRRDPEQVKQALDSALPPGLDIVAVADAEVASRPPNAGGLAASVPVAQTAAQVSLADRLQASSWEIVFPGANPDQVRQALDTFLAADSVEVERWTKKGVRILDARAAVLRAEAIEGVAADALGPHSGGAVPARDEDVPDAGRSGQASQASADTEPGTVPGTDAGPVHAPALRCVVEHQAPTVRPEEVLAGLKSVAGFVPPETPRVTRTAQGVWDAERQTLVPPPL